METDQIDVAASTVIRDFEQIYDAEESRFPRQSRGDIRHPDRLNRVHFDLPFLHCIPAADFHMGTRPDPDTARDLSATNPLAQPLGKHHNRSLP